MAKKISEQEMTAFADNYCESYKASLERCEHMTPEYRATMASVMRAGLFTMLRHVCGKDIVESENDNDGKRTES